jgi:ATP-dependent helicase HrpA
LRALSRFDALYAPVGDSAELRETSLEHLKRYLFPTKPLPALTRAHFETVLAEARQRLPGLAPMFMDRLGAILQMRQQVQQRIGAIAAPALARTQTLSSLSQLSTTITAKGTKHSIADELSNLVSSRFLERIGYDRLVHLPRYLKALLIRAERAVFNPAKSQERLRQLSPYVEALTKLKAEQATSPSRQDQIEAFRWMVEEFKVSLFAQELGTAVPVSPKRLDEQLEIIRQTT